MGGGGWRCVGAWLDQIEIMLTGLSFAMHSNFNVKFSSPRTLSKLIILEKKN